MADLTKDEDKRLFSDSSPGPQEPAEKEVRQILLRNATPDGVMRCSRTEVAGRVVELFTSYFTDLHGLSTESVVDRVDINCLA